MPAFPKPQFTYAYDVATQARALRTYRDTAPGRAIPPKSSTRLLVATWNVANLGVQQRRPQDYQVLAEIISWFDVVALQEVNDKLDGLRGILHELPQTWAAMFSDPDGNDERGAFLYDSKKVVPLELIGELGVPVADQPFIKLPGITRAFQGFDRSPYIGSFRAGSFEFVLVSAHLYYGKDDKAARERRSLEAYAVGRWADLRTKAKAAYLNDVIALGDFNIPKADQSDAVFAALTRRGLRRPDHSTKIWSAIASDSDYDQILFVPSKTASEFTGKIGVFDFDGAVFPDLFQTKTKTQFLAYLRYYVSDHRPLWAQFKI